MIDMKNNHCVHDAMFKAFFSDVNVAQDFFDLHLPPALKRVCDLTTLKICPTTFIEEDLRYHACDMLYSVRTNYGGGYIYCLIEHQSQPDKMMAFRLLRYSLAAMKQQLDQGFKQLPVVIPLLFYQGEKPYPYSTDWLDCFVDSPLARKIYSAPFFLVDVAMMPDKEIMTHRRIALLELVQKHIRLRDLLTQVDRISELMSQTWLSLELRKSMLYYIAKAGDSHDVKRLFAKLSQQHVYFQEDIMTYAQELENIGLEKGLENGRLEGKFLVAKAMLLDGFDPLSVQKYTGLSEKELLDLAH